MEKSKALIFMHSLLKHAKDSGASDIFITTGFAPAIKVDGKIAPVSNQPLSSEQSKEFVYSLMNERQAAEFSASSECNFAISLMLFFGVVTQQAISTSSALGFPIVLTGTIAAIYNGYFASDVASLPDYSLGFVYLPALFFVVSMTVFTAPLGAKLAHRLPADILKRAFGFFLIGLAVQMLSQLTA